MRERLQPDEIVSLDVLLVPKGCVLPKEAGVVVSVTSIVEFVEAVADGGDEPNGTVPVIYVVGKDVLDIVNRHANLFPLAVAVLENVPGGEYDVVFSNYTHLLPAIDIGQLLEATRIDDAEVNRMAQSTLPIHESERPASGERSKARAERINHRTTKRVSSSAPAPQSLSSLNRTGEQDVELGDSEQ